ncbi:15.4 kDa class V heat shock protein-like [Macadamia integrifolia]|uniref:15.4 kDa class V heat shock protein-like n=1 Tax=Macadamia integrifolia TaxID=60698 RepID=UPI001C53031F|nr:15.4 kDa class V heat shock protein-like [Macadamia integrifolia]
MESSDFQPSPWHLFFNAPLLFPSYLTQDNYVHWTKTPESHIYLTNLPGVRKEEIKVEVEDSIYFIIRTQAVDGEAEMARSFMRKFRLPVMIDVNGISARYEDGVLRVTVPRSFVNRRIRIDPANLLERYEILAPAA